MHRTFTSQRPTKPGYYDPPNPILVLFREEADFGDLYGSSVEFLFQLARHWSEWQSPRMGTFPVDYTDPSGPVSRTHSEETGEDHVYWYIADLIETMSAHEPDSSPESRAESHLIEDIIVHTTAVLARIYSMAVLTGTDY